MTLLLPDKTPVKSAKTILGVDAEKFIYDRAAEMDKAGVPGRDTVTEHNDRLVLEKRIPTGFSAEKKQLDAAQLQQWAEKAGLPWQDDYAARVLPWWGSDERVDRGGDIVRQNFDFKDFDNNPLLLYSHDWAGVPIGNVIQRAVITRSDGEYTGPALWLANLFSTKEQSEEADRVFRLAEARFIRAGSIGFYPQEITFVEDDAERAALGLGRWGAIYEKSALVEFSVCAVPANAGAVQDVVRRAAGNSKILAPDLDFLKSEFEKNADFAPDADLTEKEVEPDKKDVEPNDEGIQQLDFDYGLLNRKNEELAKAVKDLQQSTSLLTAVVRDFTESTTNAFKDLVDNQAGLLDSETAEDDFDLDEEIDDEAGFQGLDDIGIDVDDVDNA